MTRRLAALIPAALLASTLLLSSAQPAAAFVHALYVWDGSGGSGATCGGATSSDSNLNPMGGCGNWDNRISSFRANLVAGQCVVFYSGTSYTGLTAWTAGTLLVNMPAGMDNLTSSYRFGTSGGPGGPAGCGSPWT